MIKNIIFTVDKGYLDKCYVAIKSILAFNRADIHFHIVSPKSEDTSPLDPVILEFFNQLTEDFKHPELQNIKYSHYFYDLQSNIAIKKDYNYHFNEMVYLRFIIPSLPITGKALYLDSDLIITNNLDDLFAFDMKTASIAGVPETIVSTEYFIGEVAQHCNISRIINCGVLLFDMDYVTGAKTGNKHDWEKEILN